MPATPDPNAAAPDGDPGETMTRSFMEAHGSRWLIRSADRHPPHTCQAPMHPLSEAPGSVQVDGPAGRPGDLWQCGECQQHWLVVRTRGGDEWRPVTASRARRLLRRAGRASR